MGNLLNIEDKREGNRVNLAALFVSIVNVRAIVFILKPYWILYRAKILKQNVYHAFSEKKGPLYPL